MRSAVRGKEGMKRNGVGEIRADVRRVEEKERKKKVAGLGDREED